MHRSPTRRTLLKRSSAALLATGTASIAGCVEALPPLDQQVQYGRVDVPTGDTQLPDAAGPTYRNWFPADSALPTTDLDPAYVNYATPSNLGRDTVGFDNKEAHFFQKPYLDYFGIGYENYDHVIGMHSLPSTYVLLGEIDPNTVRETLLGSGYSEAGSYNEYSLYDRKDSPRTAAVRHGTIVWAHHEQSSTFVEAAIDAGNGDVQRQHEVDEAFALATDAIGTRPWIHVGGLGTDPTGDALVRSLSYMFDEDSIYYLHHTVYPEGQSVSEQDVRDALEKNSRSRSAWAVDIQLEDRLSTIEMRLAPEQRTFDHSDVTVPQITWGINRSNDELTIRHEVGESTPSDTITFFTITGGERTEVATQFSDAVDTIEPGDSITIQDPHPDATRIVGEFSPVDTARAAQFPLYTLQ